MRILSIRPVVHKGAGALRCLAKFDAEINEHVRVRDCALLYHRDHERHLVYGPRNAEGRCVTFSHATLDALRVAALAALETGAADVGG